jgi:signal transduction histidine kinase
MPLPDEAQREPASTSRNQLRHDLITPLTTIHGRAQLVARAVQRSPSLTAEERAGMLGSLATIEAAVRVMLTVIDGMSRDR